VTGLNASVGGALTLTAFAGCLQTNLPVTATIAKAGPASGVVTADCPGGATVSGGGYQGSGHFDDFDPSQIGWVGSVAGSGSVTIYAICLSGGLTLGSQPIAMANVVGSGIGTAQVACPAGMFLVGGGYSVGGPVVAITSSGDATMSQWTVVASDRSYGSASNLSVTAEAVCLKA
jgi:hypothetical protein